MTKSVYYYFTSFVLITMISLPQYLFAVNKYEIQNKIDETKIKAGEIEKKKRELTAQVSDLKDSASSLQKNLDQNNLKIQEIDKTFYQNILLYDINTLTISEKEKYLASLDQSIERIRFISRQYLYQKNKISKEDALVYRELMNKTLYNLRYKRAEFLDQNKDIKHRGFESLYNNIIEQKSSLEDDNQEFSKNKEEVSQNITQKSEELSLLEKRAESFKNELADYEKTLLAIVDYKKIPKPGTVVFGWPVNNPIITQNFGLTADSKSLYASGKHNGTDFRAKFEPVYAMDDGIIEGIGDTDLACNKASFGKWIFIYHPSNLATAYGHLSKIYVKSGQYVKKGTMIGVSGESGHVTGPHLHVSVFAGIDTEGNKIVSIAGKESAACGKLLIQPRAPTSAYLNPLSYLPKLSNKKEDYFMQTISHD